MSHEDVLKSFYAALKGVATESLVRVLDLAREQGCSYRSLSQRLKNSGLDLFWINGKSFVCRHEADRVLVFVS